MDNICPATAVKEIIQEREQTSKRVFRIQHHSDPTYFLNLNVIHNQQRIRDFLRPHPHLLVLTNFFVDRPLHRLSAARRVRKQKADIATITESEISAPNDESELSAAQSQPETTFDPNTIWPSSHTSGLPQEGGALPSPTGNLSFRGGRGRKVIPSQRGAHSRGRGASAGLSRMPRTAPYPSAVAPRPTDNSDTNKPQARSTRARAVIRPRPRDEIISHAIPQVIQDCPGGAENTNPIT